MIFAASRPPVDYSLCNQTVTVYHKDGEAITRTVYREAFLDFKKVRNVEKTGSREANGFLLVIPGEAVRLYPEDKVVHGVGPEVTTRDEWAAFIPVKVPGLVVIKYVDQKFWMGRQVHVEAGG